LLNITLKNSTTSAIQLKTLDCHDYAQSETVTKQTPATSNNYERRAQTANNDHL